MKIAFLLYPTAKIKINEDTSFWLMYELQKRGHKLFHFESRHLLWRRNAPHAHLAASKLHPQKGFFHSPFDAEATDLTGLDCIFIRKEPPFDNEYLYALQILEMLRGKVFMVNDPSGIALCNEKLFTLSFPKLIPETLVTSEPVSARKFIETLQGKAVIKPLNDKGGSGIFLTHFGHKNLPSLLDVSTEFGKRKILVQRYVDSARFGDKRILVLDGKILGVFLRKAPHGDFRANLGLGGTMHKILPSLSDERLVKEMAPVLLRHGLFFAGLDVIGKYLLEANVTSPSGIPELNFLNKTHLEKNVADFIEKRLC